MRGDTRDESLTVATLYKPVHVKLRASSAAIKFDLQVELVSSERYARIACFFSSENLIVQVFCLPAQIFVGTCMESSASPSAPSFNAECQMKCSRADTTIPRCALSTSLRLRLQTLFLISMHSTQQLRRPRTDEDLETMTMYKIANKAWMVSLLSKIYKWAQYLLCLFSPTLWYTISALSCFGKGSVPQDQRDFRPMSQAIEPCFPVAKVSGLLEVCGRGHLCRALSKTVE